MSIFGSIVSAIFKSKPAATTAATGSAAAPSAGSTPTSPSGGTGKAMTREEVEEMVEKLAEESDEDLEWDTSIVDLMKLLKLDSSLTARKQLAQELGYKGALDGSAAMNVWLHEQVMVKVAEGGGKVPDSIKKA